MKVKVIKCTNSNWWYANKIGEIFEVSEEGDSFTEEDEFLAINNDDWSYYIKKYDCQIIN